MIHLFRHPNHETMFNHLEILHCNLFHTIYTLSLFKVPVYGFFCSKTLSNPAVYALQIFDIIFLSFLTELLSFALCLKQQKRTYRSIGSFLRYLSRIIFLQFPAARFPLRVWAYPAYSVPGNSSITLSKQSIAFSLSPLSS